MVLLILSRRRFERSGARHPARQGRRPGRHRLARPVGAGRRRSHINSKDQGETLRDDILVLAPTRWKPRLAVKRVNEMLGRLSEDRLPVAEQHRRKGLNHPRSFREGREQVVLLSPVTAPATTTVGVRGAPRSLLGRMVVASASEPLHTAAPGSPRWRTTVPRHQTTAQRYRQTPR